MFDMTIGDTTPKRLAKSLEKLQQTARLLSTQAHNNVMPDVDEMQALRDQGVACEAEYEAFEKMYDTYPWQGSIHIFQAALRDTMLVLERIVTERGTHHVH
jgi:hypothetical protein